MTQPTDIDVRKVRLKAILGLRDAYRREMDCQIIHDSYHARGFTQSYLLRVQGQAIAYGSVGTRGPEDTVKEFYVRPPYRPAALPLFRALLAARRARWIEAQTNDRLLTLLLFDCAEHLTSDTVLFSDRCSTALLPGACWDAAVRAHCQGTHCGLTT